MWVWRRHAPNTKRTQRKRRLYGTSAEHRHPAAQGDAAGLSGPHGGFQGRMYAQGQGIRIRLLGRRPPLRLWRLQVHARPLEARGAGACRRLRADQRIQGARYRLRQGLSPA